MKIKTCKSCDTKKTVAKKTAKTATRCADKATAPKKAAKKSVTFTFHAEKGKSVYVAGDFNEWNPSETKLAFRAGVYSAKVALNAGRHEYKFIVDGAWCADPENAVSTCNDLGTFNSVIVVD